MRMLPKQKRSLIVLLIAALFLGAFWSARPGACRLRNPNITIIFRFDDYSARSDTKFEERLIGTFKQYRIPCTFGVIPFVGTGDNHDPYTLGTQALTDGKAAVLKKAMTDGTVEVALHGYSHRTNSRHADPVYSEFSGLPYEEQLKRIQEGKDFLERLLKGEVKTFIPPYNTYDANTLRCLERLGFDFISASLAGGPSESTSLKFLPSTCNVLTLRRGVHIARRRPGKDQILVVLFHACDFVEVNGNLGRITYADFCRLLDWVGSQKDIRALSMRDITKSGCDLSGKRLRSNLAVASLPPWVVPWLDEYISSVYRPTSSALTVTKRIWIATFALFAGVLVGSTVVSYRLGLLILGRLGCPAGPLAFTVTLLAVGASAYVLHDLEVYFRGGLTLVVAFSGCFGIWGALLKQKGRHMTNVRGGCATG